MPKKSRSSKRPKTRNDSNTSQYLDHAGTKHSGAATLNTWKPGANLNCKQTELERIYKLKCSMLIRHELPYVEYLELREEIERLNALREVMACEASATEKL